MLTPDRLVQRTRFGEDVELTANFGPTAYGRQPALSIAAHWLKTGKRQLFQPAPEGRSSNRQEQGPVCYCRRGRSEVHLTGRR